MEEKSRSSIDTESQCGFLIYRHDNDSTEEQLEIRKSDTHTNHFNEDVCLTHLKTLHVFTSIHDLSDWKEKTDYFHGIRVGGSTCTLLRIYGISIFFPILLNLSFTVLLYSSDLRDGKAKSFEIIPLVLLVYPQYKTIKFLV